MLGRGVKPSPDSFSYLQPALSTADLALANLESPLGISPPSSITPYNLCTSPSNILPLSKTGLDLLSLANNHTYDCGTQGADETLASLHEAGLGSIGPDAEPTLRTIHGLRLAFMAFNAVNGFDIQPAAQQISALKQHGWLVIVSIHWGAEYQAGITPAQKEIAAAFARAGAALVWGHHPHVLQHMAWIGKTAVLYSLGNALFDQGGLVSTHQSAMALVTLTPNGVEKIQVVPFVINVQKSQLSQPEKNISTRILEYFQTQP